MTAVMMPIRMTTITMMTMMTTTTGMMDNCARNDNDNHRYDGDENEDKMTIIHWSDTVMALLV